MKLGLVGYQGSGKSTVFEWFTGVKPDPALAHAGQSAMAAVPDRRMAALEAMLRPKKTVPASLELVDAAGLNRSHEGSAARLALIREAGSLVLVVAAFQRAADALRDVDSLDEDFMLADLEIVSGRIERLRESLKKARPNRDAELTELAALEPALEALESGTPLHAAGLNEHQLNATRSFRLLTEKPKFVLVNVADDEADPQRFVRALGERQPPLPAAAAPVGLELELARMSTEEREAFRAEMGLGPFDRDALVRTLVDASGLLIFFTANEKELRSWLLPRGATALEAAACVHTDLARGFIRAEVMQSDDLVRLGSEREVKAQGLLRAEPKDYVVRDGDILHIRFSV